MKTILKICGKDFHFTNEIMGRSFDGFDIKCNTKELIGILYDDKGYFLKLWGNSKSNFDNYNMDCTYEKGFHRLKITGVDEL